LGQTTLLPAAWKRGICRNSIASSHCRASHDAGVCCANPVFWEYALFQLNNHESCGSKLQRRPYRRISVPALTLAMQFVERVIDQVHKAVEK
jgi:hypothetical protein